MDMDMDMDMHMVMVMDMDTMMDTTSATPTVLSRLNVS